MVSVASADLTAFAWVPWGVADGCCDVFSGCVVMLLSMAGAEDAGSMFSGASPAGSLS